MPTSEQNALSANALKTVLTNIHENQQQNRQNAKRHGWWLAGGLVAGVFAPVLPLGLATLGVLAANIVTVVAAAKLVQDAGRGRMLHKLAANITKNNFAGKLNADTGKLVKLAAKTRKISNIGVYATLGLFVALFIPPVAPVAAVLYGTAFLGTMGAIGVNSWVTGKAVAAVDTANATYQATGVAPAAPAALVSAPGVSKGPSPAAGFNHAVNNNVPPPSNDVGSDAAKTAKINPLKP